MKALITLFIALFLFSIQFSYSIERDSRSYKLAWMDYSQNDYWQRQQDKWERERWQREQERQREWDKWEMDRKLESICRASGGTWVGSSCLKPFNFGPFL